MLPLQLGQEKVTNLVAYSKDQLGVDALAEAVDEDGANVVEGGVMNIYFVPSTRRPPRGSSLGPFLGVHKG